MTYDEEKYKEFTQMLQCDAEVVIIHHPQVLGDNYEELCENLNRLAGARKNLSIVSPEDRGKGNSHGDYKSDAQFLTVFGG